MTEETSAHGVKSGGASLGIVLKCLRENGRGVDEVRATGQGQGRIELLNESVTGNGETRSVGTSQVISLSFTCTKNPRRQTYEDMHVSHANSAITQILLKTFSTSHHQQTSVSRRGS